MEPISDQKILRLARLSADLSPDERKEFLYRECGGDGELRQAVEAALHKVEKEPTQVFTNDYEKALPEHYQLMEMLGRGGMAEVFRAEDNRLGRSVAIKFLNSEFRKDPDRMRRFSHEARAVSALNHPNILTIYDIGEKEGVQFIVSEYVEGETLSARISRGKIPIAEAVEMVIQIASALAASHKTGIVHRDMKPDNVMIRRDGSVKVLDFGLAKDTGNDYSNFPDFDARTLDRIMTAPGVILGTPQYMSPEQARGGHLDARTDIFSLGIILFEMVTARSPFKGGSMADTIAAIVSKEPPRIEEYVENPPVTLARIIDRALRKDKEERYLTMGHLLSDLKELRQELATDYDRGPQTAGTQVRATGLDNPVPTGIVDAIVRPNWFVVIPVVVLAVLAVWWFYSGTRLETPSSPGQLRSVVITNWSSGAPEPTTAASFSPDARWIAFAATLSGAMEIWVKPVVGGDPVQVTKNGFYNQYPVWSPNGQEIGFFSRRGENFGIWRTSMTGGDQVQVLGNIGGSARPIRWTEDGKIYFQEGPDLFSVDVRLGNRAQVTHFASVDQKPRSIEISPDGGKIAYSIKDGGQWKVRVRRIDASDDQEIATSEAQVVDLVWRPDGNSVLYSCLTEAAYQIFEAGLGRSAPIQLSNANADVYLQDVSSDGSRILYSSVNETSDLWRVDTQDLTESLEANDVASEYWADVSPDGKSIAFQSVAKVDSPFDGAIKLKPAAGAAITVSPSGFLPVWSNDGQWIAFFRRGPDGIGIWRARPTGDGATLLVDGAATPPDYTQTPFLKVGAHHISWSPDDRSLAYVARVGNLSNIWISEADNSGSRPLTNNTDLRERFCCPAWTPGGKTVVFASEPSMLTDARPSVHRVWVWDSENNEARTVFESRHPFLFIGLAEGGKEAVIVQRADDTDLTANPKTTYVFLLSLQAGLPSKVNTLDSAYFYNIHLSRDGRSIAFVSRRENETALWSVPVRGGTPKKLIADNDPKVLFSSLSWSPDGRSIVFGRQTRTNLLSMLSK